MKKQKVNIKRITEFIKPEWFFMTISIINGLFYVIFNAISIWLTASLVNNVLIDFNKLVQNQKQLLAKEFPTINEKMKILVNEFILRDTNIETLRVLCFSIVLIFILKKENFAFNSQLRNLNYQFTKGNDNSHIPKIQTSYN